MARADKSPGITVTIDDTVLSEAIRTAAADRHKSVRDIVAEALKKWLKDEAEREMREDTLLARESREDAEPIVEFDQYVVERQKRA